MTARLFAACALLLATQVLAQSEDVDDTTRCKQQLLRYEEALRLVKQTLGTAAYETMKARQMPDAERDALLFKGGYCAVARVLRERKLLPFN
jgi:hypothetical protein